jgi:hypothetical protein
MANRWTTGENIVLSGLWREKIWWILPAMMDLGVYSIGQDQAIRAEGEVVIQRMHAGLPPFCEGWEHWSPPDYWLLPHFPPNWDSFI